jgi:hypothetical protein
MDGQAFRAEGKISGRYDLADLTLDATRASHLHSQPPKALLGSSVARSTDQAA